MSSHQPLLTTTIEADDPLPPAAPQRVTAPHAPPPPHLLATTQADAEAGIAGIFRQSAHPVALAVLWALRTAAVAVYVLCGFFTDNYVLSTVVVVVLLAMDFWNTRNVAGRILVGLRFWNQVDEDGESYWVFESRDPSRPANPVDSRMFWTALYVFPVLWLLLFIVSILKFSISFLPIVLLALVFNITNVIGFTYADRDAKQRWAQQGYGLAGLGGLGGQILSSAVSGTMGRLFGR
ncbi:DUF846-domain-containing protein [Calocera cornea HHB12733]|uniref:Golgi apparatus membrane protein TVP23 n=1 Tax=Calocera cornea HHB12733 TaxID=1353952 RepID=A0A165F0B9_9BASI|nr:DUF846-domain-containing protein [Calocera cornea HHB12733]